MMIDEEKQEWENIKEQINKKFDEVGKKLDKIKDVVIPNQKMTVVSEKEIKALQEKLDIAIQALEKYGNRVNWDKEGISFGKYTKGWILANKSLVKIKEIN